MAEENIKEVIEEIKEADEDTLRSTIEKWFESTRTSGMKIGAQYISAAIFGVIQKHIKKKTGAKPSLRDYTRMTEEILQIITVQLNQTNATTEHNDDYKEDDING